jgi:nitrile hydratase subunit beta
MNGIHDMGGMHGFGPVIREENEPVFHEPWEGRAYGLFSRLGAKLPPPYPGVGRTYIERIPPATYLQMRYYDRFLESALQRAIAAGLITPAEFEARLHHYEDNPAASVPRREDQEEVAEVRRRLRTQLRPATEGRTPRFRQGDAVVAINISRLGHSRLPRYIRGKRGTVERVNGLYPIEDEKAFNDDATPQAVYTVGFDGLEVWGPECEPNLRVYLELWEGYLAPVSPAT